KSIKNNFKNETANTYNYIGSLLWNNSKFDSSIIYYKTSLNIKKELNDKAGEADILTNLGIVYKDIGEYKQAIKNHEKALAIKEKIGDKQEIAQTLNNIGSVYLKINNLDNALIYYNKALSIRKEINELAQIAQSQNNIALVYKKLGKIDDALKYFSKSLQNRQRTGNKVHIANSLTNIGNTYWKLNKLDLALKYYLDALELRQEIGNKKSTASSLNNIGIIYDNIGNYTKALNFYKKALIIKTASGDNVDIAYSYHIIGNTYLKLNKLEEAKSYYQKSLELRKIIGDEAKIANSLKSIGNIYAKKDNEKQCMDFYKQSISIYKKINDINGECYVNNEIGNFYYKSNNNIAIKYFQKAIALADTSNNKFIKALCSRKLGEIQISNKNYGKGLENIQISLKLGRELNNLEMIKNAYYALYNYYKNVKKTDRALIYYIKYTHAKDSILSKISSQKVLETQMNYELKLRQNQIKNIESQIDNLTAEKKLKNLEIKKQKNLRNFLIIITLLIIILVILILKGYLNKKRTNTLLQGKYTEIEKTNLLLSKSEANLKESNATKDKFFSIIAHDLKNPFNALYSLTDILSQNFDDYSKKELKEHFKIIKDSAEQLLDLLDNLLRWSRSQRGKIKYNPATLNLNSIIKDNIDLLKINADKKNISIENNTNSNTNIFADKDMLTTIFRNLISNAIKFSYNNDTIKINFKDLENKIQISVIDKGVGINDEDISKLFRIDVH
ncbi:MAG: tetratricopeptide repeat-containing sensor histidine kinase, partial [Bacteroidota bacterium]|nr:tetratricopeptide repeat-containing sensor histidine kinase [Bacteroidota bacterium]